MLPGAGAPQQGTSATGAGAAHEAKRQISGIILTMSRPASMRSGLQMHAGLNSVA
jgi:hypothetical protein